MHNDCTASTGRRLGAIPLALLITVLAGGACVPGVAAAQATTWYVSAAAPADGNGSAGSPFKSLAQVESASQPGDTIMVEPVPTTTPPLDGGITLKSGQKLIGDGGAVVGAAAGASLPRLTNSGITHNGDAVDLANGVEVRNVVIAGANRGGIYGLDAANVTVMGNDVSATNRQCSDGFIIGPFTLPPTIALGTTAPPSPNLITLNNGWAAIMTDYSTATTSTLIQGNSVHDTACGDGIDLRAKGTSQVTAQLNGNTLHNINLGAGKVSVLAVGLQGADGTKLTATLTGNTESAIAPPTTSVLNNSADSEGLFVNPTGQAHVNVTVDSNQFHNGYGNFSANGLEYVTTSGTPTSQMSVTNSTFDTVTGDIIENYNLSTDGAQQSLSLDTVTAQHSQFPGSVINPIVPANLGTCLVTTNFGRTDHTHLTVKNSHLGDCSGDGIGVVQYVPDGPSPATAELTFDVSSTTINGTAANNVDVINVGSSAILTGKVQSTNLANAQKALLRTSNQSGTIGNVEMDFGGGTLSSQGQNCFATTGNPQVSLSGISVDAKQNWWGQPNGPSPSQVQTQNATLNAQNPLPTAPRSGC